MNRSKACKSNPTSQNRELANTRFTRSVGTYLSKLEDTVPSSTYHSQKQALSKFATYVRQTPDRNCELVDLSAKFVSHLSESGEQSVETVSGHAHTLSNYIGYELREDPELIEAQIFHTLPANLHRNRIERVKEELFGSLNEDTSPSGYSKGEIKEAIQHLGRTQYGSRLHAFLEVIRETKARPEQARLLDLCDFSPERNTITVGLPDTSLLGKYGLIETRTASISGYLGELLSEYINRDRKQTSAPQKPPLFTTSHGRVTSSTIRRAFKTTFTLKRDGTSPDAADGGGQYRCQSILPSDIWWYSLATIDENKQ